MQARGEWQRVAAGIAARRRQPLPGLLLVALGASLWGLSGVAAQSLFAHYGITPQWLVTVRMLGAGALLYAWLRPPLPRRSLPLLAVFGVGGLAAVQYTYLGTISLTNAATATFLQNLFIPITALYEVIATGKRLTGRRAAALLLALLGVSLLVLAGPDGHLALRIGPIGLVLGLLAAVAAAFYTLISAALVGRHGAGAVTTWGMLIGGVVASVWAPPWSAHPSGDATHVVLLTLFVVVAGTATAFGLYLAGLATISPTEAAVATAVEPIVAALASLLLLGVVLAPLQYGGGALIVAAVVLLQLSRRVS